jgi:hypothetical protein
MALFPQGRQQRLVAAELTFSPSRRQQALALDQDMSGEEPGVPPQVRGREGYSYLSLLGMGAIVYDALGDGFRVVLLLTVVLLFVQFLVMTRRFS